MIYCNDTDLLHWEPNIFKDAAFASQTLLSGTGTLAGTTFTLDAGSFIGASVAARNVIVLTGTPGGSFPIVSVDSDEQVTLSVLYDALFPANDSAQPTPVGSGADLGFTVRTFSPQARIISRLLDQTIGLEPDEELPRVHNPEVLRRPCALGTLQMIYAALAAAGGAAEHSVRADLYERLYRRSLRTVRVQLDRDGDGEADLVRALNVLNLVRS